MRFDREKENAQLFVSRRRRSVLKTKKAQMAFLRSDFDNTNTSLSAKWFQPQSNKIKKKDSLSLRRKRDDGNSSFVVVFLLLDSVVSTAAFRTSFGQTSCFFFASRAAITRTTKKKSFILLLSRPTKQVEVTVRRKKKPFIDSLANAFMLDLLRFHTCRVLSPRLEETLGCRRACSQSVARRSSHPPSHPRMARWASRSR